MTDVQAATHALVERTTAAQGIPERMTDPATLVHVAAILRAGRRRAT